MNFPWINDPKDKKPSVTVTLVVLSTVAMLIAIGLEMSGMAKATNLTTEFLWGTLATYLGRRISVGKVSANAAQGEVK